MGWMMRSGKLSLWFFARGVFVFGCLFASAAPAIGLYNARSLGLGGSYTAVARGVEAPDWNPANLGLDFSRHHWSVSIFSAGVQAFNDSYSRSQYEQYNGKNISTARQDILNAINGGELNLFVDAEIALAGLAYKAFAFNIKALVFSKIELSRSLLELFLNGNSQNTSYDFAPVGGNGVALWKISYSAAKPIPLKGFQEAALGATINIYSGKSVFQVTRASGRITTHSDAISGGGEIVLRHALGGRGVGLDFGISGLIRDHWYISASISNIINHLKWQRQTRLFQYQFTLNETNIETLDNIARLDELYRTVKDTVKLNSFSTRLPEIFRLGMARIFNQWLFSIDYKQGLRDLAGASLNPELSAGVEYRLSRKLALRTGLVLGGDSGYACAIGLGSHFWIFYWDIGCSWIQALWPGNARGYAFAISSGLRF